LVHYYNQYAFGLDMPGMTSNNGAGYRYGYNGKEKDRDFQNNYDYGFRIYNAGVGRFLSVDPIADSYPWNSPYAFAENRVIDGIDLEGLEYKSVTDQNGNVTGFEWDPANAYDSKGKLKDGYYERAIHIQDQGTWSIGNWSKKKQRYESRNVGSAIVTVYSYTTEKCKEDGQTYKTPIVETYNGTSMPSDPERFATVKAGFYNAIPWLHKGDYPALQLRNPNGTGEIPIETETNPSTGKSYAVGVNIHKAGKNNYTGTIWSEKKYAVSLGSFTVYKKYSDRYSGCSEACQLIDVKKWDNFMNNFPDGVGKIGVLIDRDKYVLPKLETPKNPDTYEIHMWNTYRAYQFLHDKQLKLKK